jgi:transcriptional regulator with AAA-type ATPase domain
MNVAVALMHAVRRFSIASRANNEFRETRNPAKQYANSKLPVLSYGRSGFP